MCPDGARVTYAFYYGIKYYDFNDPQFSTNARDFTQLVWHGTWALGVGFTPYYIVTVYYPPGNIPGEFEENVPRKIN